MKISAFADCNSESVVLRLPYEIAVSMVKNLADSEEKAEIIRWLKIAASRSKKFSKLLDEAEDSTEANSGGGCQTGAIAF